jgi:hypothetical protein
MGHVYSYLVTGNMDSLLSNRLCNDVLSDTDDFLMVITIHSSELVGVNSTAHNYSCLVDHLQKTGVVLSYSYCKSIYLSYDRKKQETYLRSNVASDIISSVATDVTSYCIKNKICDPYLVEVELFKQPSNKSEEYILKLVKQHNYFGHIYGLEVLSEQIIKDQFSL